KLALMFILVTNLLITSCGSTQGSQPEGQPQPAAGEVTDQSACTLLTSDDIEAATGEKPSEPHSADRLIQSATKGAGSHSCMWNLPTRRGQLTVSTAPLPPGASVNALAKHNPGIEALKEAHWTEEAKDFGSVWCSILTPPASQKDGLIMSGCYAGVKGKMLIVQVTSPTKGLSLDQTKALLDKTIEHQR
ncbi:MAG TPA: hypothetical protein VGV87_26010, partial [Blastocatellia bacterium]|nr:hypothetical protein [Blastocatellia bacterium]